MDKRVELHGTSRADMNGKRGVATDFHRYRADRFLKGPVHGAARQRRGVQGQADERAGRGDGRRNGWWDGGEQGEGKEQGEEGAGPAHVNDVSAAVAHVRVWQCEG